MSLQIEFMPYFPLGLLQLVYAFPEDQGPAAFSARLDGNIVEQELFAGETDQMIFAGRRFSVKVLEKLGRIDRQAENP